MTNRGPEKRVYRSGSIASKKKGKKNKKKANRRVNPNERLVTENRKARHNYLVLDTLECGLSLVGSEVKSLRAGNASIGEAYGRVRNGEVYLVGADIQEYEEANRFNHNPKRDRKLLLHRSEIKKFAFQALEQGLTLVPLKLYFKRGKAKILMGLCRGKQVHDKRRAMKEAESDRALRLSMMKHQ